MAMAFAQSFAVSDDEVLTAPIRILSEEETIRKVEWIGTRLRVCWAGLLGVAPTAIFNDVFLKELGNRRVGYIHRPAKDFLATLDMRNKFIGK
jgi:hypothetical protein